MDTFETPTLMAYSSNRSSTPRALALRITATPTLCGPAGILMRTSRASRPSQPQPLAVQRDLHLLVAADRGQAEAGPGAADAKAVLGIEREHVLHHDAAARAERLALAVVGLRQPGRGGVGGDARDSSSGRQRPAG